MNSLIRMEDVAALLAESYGISGELLRLPGENFNVLASTGEGKRFVLKLAGEEQTSECLELEHQVVQLRSCYLYKNAGTSIDCITLIIGLHIQAVEFHIVSIQQGIIIQRIHLVQDRHVEFGKDLGAKAVTGI